jgi:hypothetical protein
MAEFVLPRFLVDFEREHKRHLSVGLVIANSASVWALVGEGRADLGLAAKDPSGDGPALSETSFCEDEVVVGVPEAHPWATADEVSLDDFVRTPMIMRDPGANSRIVVDAALEPLGHSLARPPSGRDRQHDGGQGHRRLRAGARAAVAPCPGGTERAARGSPRCRPPFPPSLRAPARRRGEPPLCGVRPVSVAARGCAPEFITSGYGPQNRSRSTAAGGRVLRLSANKTKGAGEMRRSVAMAVFALMTGVIATSCGGGGNDNATTQAQTTG